MQSQKKKKINNKKRNFYFVRKLNPHAKISQSKTKNIKNKEQPKKGEKISNEITKKENFLIQKCDAVSYIRLYKNTVEDYCMKT